MNKNIARRWVRALISGKYKQAQRVLKGDPKRGRGVGHCCLGVLCDITRKETGGTWGGLVKPSWSENTFEASAGYFVLNNELSNAFPPNAVYDLCGLDENLATALASMNDEGKTFRTIAKRIAKEAGIKMPVIKKKAAA